MAIIKSTIIDNQFNRVTSDNPFYWCSHSSDFVIFRSESEDYPNESNTVVDTKNNIFGADTYQELIDEISRLNLIDNTDSNGGQ